MCCKVGRSGVGWRNLPTPGWWSSSRSATPGVSALDGPWTGTHTPTLTFRGHYDYSLDAKKRLNIPAKFRPAFSDGVVLAKSLEPCVSLWAPEAFESFTESVLGKLNPVSSERRKLTRFFAGSSFDTELDSAGRVSLNPPLLAHAGIEKEVVVVGNLDRLEIWDRQAWLADQDALHSEAVTIAEGLGHPA